jgi:phage-related baseplate assembly protein
MELDLRSLPAPALIEALDYETILARMIGGLVSLDPAYNAILESDPAIKVLEVAAARELILRQRVNDAFKATLLAFSGTTDLDNLGAFYGVIRRAGETDEEFRVRVVLRIQGSSTAGGAAWYRYQGLTASDRIRDIAVSSPEPGVVEVAVLSKEVAILLEATTEELNSAAAFYGTSRGVGETDATLRARLLETVDEAGGRGTATPQLLAVVDDYIQDDAVRVVTDTVNVVSATIYDVDVVAGVYLYPDTPMQVFNGLEATLREQFLANVSLGWDLTRTWTISRIHPAGVQRIELSSPTTDVVVGPSGAVALNSITLNFAGYDR